MEIESAQAFFARAARAAGLDAFGVCAWDPALDANPCRARGRLPEHPRSILVLLFPYYVGAYPYRNLSRYAMVDDYHTVAGALLEDLCRSLSARFPEDAFVPFVDNSPLLEVEAARRAGLGVRGLHGMLINKRYGSYHFIGEIVTTKAFVPSLPSQGTCLLCGACARACPGGALGEACTAPGRGAAAFNSQRCLSFLTQKKRLEDPQALAAVAAAGFAWGCDVCGDVCPMNRTAAFSPIGAFYRNIRPTLTHNNLEEQFSSRAFAWRGRGVILRNLELIHGRGLDGPEEKQIPLIPQRPEEHRNLQEKQNPAAR